MKKKLLTALAGAVVCAHAGAKAIPNSATDLALDECTTANAIGDDYLGAVNREAAPSTTMMAALEKMQALATRYEGKGKPGETMGELMSRDDSVQFEAVSNQIRTINFTNLAESRLQRDLGFLQDTHEMSLKNRDTGLDLGHFVGLIKQDANPNVHRGSDHELIVYTYLYTLRTAFVDDDFPAVRNQSECSINLAIERESNANFALWQKQVTTSPALAEVAFIRKKYGLGPGTAFDTAKATPVDAQRMQDLQPQLQALQRFGEYLHDMNGLRYFEEAAMLEYQWQREDILMLGASGDTSAYNKLDAERYAKLTPVQQKAINVWRHLDEVLPAQATTNAESVANAAALQR